MGNRIVRAVRRRSPILLPQPERQRGVFWLYVSYAVVIFIFFIIYILINPPGAPSTDYNDLDDEGVVVKISTKSTTIGLNTDEVFLEAKEMLQRGGTVDVIAFLKAYQMRRKHMKRAEGNLKGIRNHGG